MKVTIDPNICIGCTLCVEICPEIFRMESDKAMVYVGAFSDNAKGKYKKAADDCPVTAISITA